MNRRMRQGGREGRVFVTTTSNPGYLKLRLWSFDNLKIPVILSDFENFFLWEQQAEPFGTLGEILIYNECAMGRNHSLAKINDELF